MRALRKLEAVVAESGGSAAAESGRSAEHGPIERSSYDMAGVADEPRGSRPPDWMVRSEEIDEVIAAGFSKSDAILLGRRTYLEGARIWPSLSGEMPMADFMNDTLKHVVSSTLDTPLGWANATLIARDLAAQPTDLKRQPGKNIQIAGSPTLG
jgi:hypothetical protein